VEKSVVPKLTHQYVSDGVDEQVDIGAAEVIGPGQVKARSRPRCRRSIGGWVSVGTGARAPSNMGVKLRAMAEDRFWSAVALFENAWFVLAVNGIDG
jgi:hypothetical protein